MPSKAKSAPIIPPFKGGARTPPRPNLSRSSSEPTLTDYRNLLVNVTPETYWPAFQKSYVRTLRKISHIRSYFGIEREFDRYYNKLKN